MSTKRKGEPPAVMTYQEEWEAARDGLSLEDIGRLYIAKGEYLFEGKEPNIGTGTRLSMLWLISRSKMVADRRSYWITSIKNTYKVYLRDHKDEILSIGEWFMWKKALLAKEYGEDRLPVAYREITEDDLS